jgi:hypothetical protein
LEDKQKAIHLPKLLKHTVMSKKIFFSLFLMVAVFGFWTCNKDEDKADTCSAAWASELSNEVEAMSNAAQVYMTSPTPANCLAYKQAMQDYLDALEPYGNCPTLTGQSREQWQAALDAAQLSVDNLDCSAAL